MEKRNHKEIGWAKARSCAPCPRVGTSPAQAPAPLPTLRFNASGTRCSSYGQCLAYPLRLRSDNTQVGAGGSIRRLATLLPVPDCADGNVISRCELLL